MFPKRNLKRNIAKLFQQPAYGIGVFLKRLKASIYYIVNPQSAPAPEAVTFFLTYKCNLSCRMCGQWGDKGVTKHKTDIAKEMTFEEIKSIIDDIAHYKPNITLFGGEPMLHKDIVDIVRYIKSKHMHCVMITNGLLLEKYAEDLIDAGLDELNISIDGPSRLHDEIRGFAGLFERIYHGTVKVSEHRRVGKPLVNIQTTITKYNYKSIDELLEVAKSMGADSITFHHLIYMEKEDIEQTKGMFPELKPADWEGFISEHGIEPDLLIESLNKIEELKGDYNFNINTYPNFTSEEIEKYYSEKGWFPNSYRGRCMSPWVCAYIFPNGDLKPCLNYDYSFGNLKENSFKKVWRSNGARYFRRKLKDNKMFPVCKKCTEIFRY